MRFILRFKRELKRATNASKIIIDKREVKNKVKKTKKTKAKAKRTKTNTKVNVKTNARATTIITTTTTTTTNKKRLSEQFACTYINLVFKTTLMLLSYLLLFNNSRKCANNALYSQKLIKLSN